MFAFGKDGGAAQFIDAVARNPDITSVLFTPENFELVERVNVNRKFFAVNELVIPLQLGPLPPRRRIANECLDLKPEDLPFLACQ